MRGAAVVASAVIALIVGVLLFQVAGSALETDIEECEAAGGEQSVHGEVLYCVFDNGTGRPLGTDETPAELENEPMHIEPAFNMRTAFRAVGAAFSVTVAVVIVTRFLP